MVRMVVVVELCPAREPRLNQVAHAIIRDLFFILRDTRGELGPRADEGKVAFNHAPELRQLVEAREAQYPADRSYFILLHAAGKVGLVPAHAAKFVNSDAAVVLP